MALPYFNKTTNACLFGPHWFMPEQIFFRQEFSDFPFYWSSPVPLLQQVQRTACVGHFLIWRVYVCPKATAEHIPTNQLFNDWKYRSEHSSGTCTGRLGPDWPINGGVIIDLGAQLPLSHCWGAIWWQSAKNHEASHLSRQTPIMKPFFCLHIKIEI